jgi:iron complex outermembrane receptor protein
MQGLEAGTVIATQFNGLPVTNGGQSDAPTLDRQYELGAKAQLGESLVTLALFDINRATAVFVLNADDTYTSLRGAREEHKGAELGISGKVTPDLTLWGGATWFSAKITREPDDPTLVGKVPVGVARSLAKVYGEYALRAVPGLALTAGVYYTGNQWVDAPNTATIPSFTTADIGARYETRVYGRPTILRFNVSNLADKDYWLQTGELGVPRQFSFTAEMRF